MKTVIIQKDCYERVSEVFDDSPFHYRVIPVSRPNEMVAAQKETGAESFIIGAEAYPAEFYQSIEPHSLIVRYGVGYDKVPIDLCRERGISVAYTPGTLDQSVAEHAVGLMLACARRIPQQDQSVRQGDWLHVSGAEMAGKTAAIIGFGKIGRRVAQILKTGVGMRIAAFDVFPEIDPSHAPLVDHYTTDFAAAVRAADFVSLHMAVNDQTRGFIERSRLAAMKSSAYLVNTARGALVHESDLYEALVEGKLAGVALDVFENEPYVPAARETDLRNLPNVILTAHSGSNTLEANRRMAEMCIQNVEAWQAGDKDRLMLVPEITPG